MDVMLILSCNSILQTLLFMYLFPSLLMHFVFKYYWSSVFTFEFCIDKRESTDDNVGFLDTVQTEMIFMWVNSVANFSVLSTSYSVTISITTPY